MKKLRERQKKFANEVKLQLEQLTKELESGCPVEIIQLKRQEIMERVVNFK